MRVSVIIVSRNAREQLIECVESVRDHASESVGEIIVFDNASSDGAPEAIASCCPGVRLIRSARNLGFARANNAAASEATGDAMLLLNSDTVVTPGMVEALLAVLADDKGVGLAAPANVSCDGTHQRSVEHLITPATEFSRRARKRAASEVESALAAGGDISSLGYCCGAAMMVRREAFEAVGGFDERFFFYFEDADLCKRIAESGRGIRVVDDARIVHTGGASTTALRLGSAVEMTRGRLIYMRKHFGVVPAIGVGLGQFLGRLRRFACHTAVAVASLGLANGAVQKASFNGRIVAWFVFGLPDRRSRLYRFLIQDWG